MKRVEGSLLHKGVLPLASFKSPRAYRYMAKLFALPTPSMLRYWLQRFVLNAEWNEPVFSLIKEQIRNKCQKEKLCDLVFDAISIRYNLTHNCGKNLVGFEDLGKYGQSDEVADCAMGFMVKGL